MSMTLSFAITRDLSGLRLDQAVSVQLPSCSRSRAASLIAKGLIRVDDQVKRPGYRLKVGERVSGQIPDDASPLIQAQAMDLKILHEDDHILVVDKAPGMVVHPAPGHDTHTLVNGLLAHDPIFKADHWDPMRPGIVHRLDRDTSGLIVLAKTAQSLAFLQKEFKQRRVQKTYLALARGKAIPDSGQIELPIGRHPKKRKLMAIVPETGKYARTGFKVVQRFDQGALMEVRLYTGRTHQIRVHFYEQSMPLMGDRVYQLRRHRKKKGLAPRQMLHSWKLGFRHPYSGRRMEFQAPMPDDFLSLIATLTSS